MTKASDIPLNAVDGSVTVADDTLALYLDISIDEVRKFAKQVATMTRHAIPSGNDRAGNQTFNLDQHGVIMTADQCGGGRRCPVKIKAVALKDHIAQL